MNLIKPTAIALVATLGAAGAFAIANAQTQAPANPPAQSGPSNDGPRGPGWGPGDGPRGRMGGWGMGGDDERGWRGNHWRMGRGDEGPGWRNHRFSKEDRTAFFNARIAAVHAGLGLTADQEKLWPPVESAVRDMAKSMTEAIDKARDERPKDPIEGMKRRAEWQIARGEAMKKVADAAGPLYAALTPEQKDRLPALVRPGMRGHVGRWMHEHGMRWGRGRDNDRG